MLESLLTYGSVFSPVFGIYLGVVLWRSLSKSLRFILAAMIASISSDIAMLVLAMSNTRNLPVAHAYGLLEGVLFILFFKVELPRARVLLTVVLAAYIVGYSLDSLFISGLTQFNAFSRSAEALLMILLSIAFFYHVYDHESDIFIEKAPGFWVVVGMLFYFSGALFSFILATEILSQSPERFYGSWMLHNISNAIKNTIFTIALWKSRENLIRN